jgi:putative glutamine amidotransferase
VHFEPAPAEQLAFDDALLAAARGRGLPVLAICYGMQLLVRQQGGALLYDIPSDLPDAGPHRLPEADGRHALCIAADSRLAACLGVEEDAVNSLHHQGVAEPGSGLSVSARAPDDLIEAVEAEGPGFCVGVQWHPEKLEGAHRERLFAAFIAACTSV